jgi:hypothetical protein
MIAVFVCLLASSSNLIENSGFEKINGDKIPVGFALQGSVKRRYAGYLDEISTYGVALEPKPGTSGSVSQTVQNIDPSKGKWMYFTFRGRAEEDFKVSNNQLFTIFHENEILDISLMSLCNGGILSASSYSWWASFFIKIKKVNSVTFVAPNYWMGRKLEKWIPSRGIKSDWIHYL